ncbi:hypothetical protein AAK967_02240 [Atopobiaceae bacterium 24-176]
MTYVRKEFLLCDKCGSAQEAPAEGWLGVGPDRHLCPGCAATYLAKKRDMERELRRLSGEPVFDRVR